MINTHAKKKLIDSVIQGKYYNGDLSFFKKNYLYVALNIGKV